MCIRASVSLLCMLLAAASTEAQTIWYVDDDNCPGPGSGTEADPFCFIQFGIALAQNGDEVLVAPGTYNEKIHFGGKAITVRSLDGSGVTTIDGTGLTGSLVQCVTNEGPDTVLDGFTIFNGHGILGGGMLNEASHPTVTNCDFVANFAPLGGGMFNRNSSPVVTHCVFSENESSIFGGGMYNKNSSPVVTLCVFNGNQSADDGGGMYNWEGSNPTVSHCAFSGNSAFTGGGMVNFGASNPMISNCTFSQNSANSGGGIASALDSNPTVINSIFNGNIVVLSGGAMLNNGVSSTISFCEFEGNSAHEGGAMWNNGGTLTVSHCTIRNNSAIVGGGLVNQSGNITVDHCTLIDNAAEKGGGLFNWSGNPKVINSTFLGNGASNHGGAIANRAVDLILFNCLFTGNSATIGGAVHSYDSTLAMTNCTVSGNNADSGRAMAFDLLPLPQQNPSDLSMSNCILWDGGDEVWNNDKSMVNIAYSNVQSGWPGEGNIDVDPLFVDPGFWDDNGTPEIPNDDFWVDGDYRLSPGSPCIDAANNTAVPEGIVTDLDGNSRFVDDPNTDDTGFGDSPIVDMGAYEFRDPCADDDGDGRATICHIPPGNPGNPRTISVKVNAVPAHLGHGDECGACE